MKLITYQELRSAKGITYQRDHLRRKCKAGTFPTPVHLSERRIGWIEEEIDDYLADLRARRDGRAA
jgi:predicted DNA-binding transcriptional regulator AlpA